MARTFLKELYFDLILRFCRVADNQFRKDLIKSFGRQKSETLRKKVVETKKDSTIHQISMPYITNFIGISGGVGLLKKDTIFIAICTFGILSLSVTVHVWLCKLPRIIFVFTVTCFLKKGWFGPDIYNSRKIVLYHLGIL